MTETFGSFSDAFWAPLREALPSFSERWRAYTSRPDYDPLDGSQNMTEFESHLDDFVDADVDALAPLFVVMERLYTDWHPEMHEVLTIKVLENLTHAADERGIDLRRLARMLPGPRTRDAWRQALMWTHRECTWDDERGLVPDFPPPVPVGRVRITDVPEGSPDTPTFLIGGELLGGAVRAGNFVWIRLTSCHHAWREIVAVETLASSPESLRLTLAYHDHEGLDEHWLVPGSWFDAGDEREIIEQLPPEMERLFARSPPSSSDS
jgi:hypothetical protein